MHLFSSPSAKLPANSRHFLVSVLVGPAYCQLLSGVTDFGAYLWGLSFLQLLCHKLHRKDILVWAHEERANAASDEVRCVQPIPASVQLVKTSFTTVVITCGPGYLP